MISLTPTEIQEKLKPILARHIGKKDELIPILQETQDELRYLPEDAMREIARFLKISVATVYGVSTFYHLFKLKPSGKKIIRVCRGTACHVRGSPRIVDEVSKVLNVKPGETTPDMEYTLETIACFGSCALAPVMVVDKTVYGRVTPGKIKEILARPAKQEVHK
ncbi:MAG: NADH-quinone oxidoreductase subunit NuoE [Dehalococcoidales bacterium]|nr:NADH-quinone oxidoreductase subunit NuoE [Dehalococcoidales bacterium]